MPVPSGYDLGLQHAAVNGGAASGWLLEEHDEALIEEQSLQNDVAVDTAGQVSAVSYGLGARVYRLRLALRTDILDRGGRPRSETPADRQALLREYAARTEPVTLQLASGDRPVLFVEALKFLSGPLADGCIALVCLVDVT